MQQKYKLLSCIIGAAFTLALTPGTYAAGTLSGKIGVKLTIGAGCTVNNSTSEEGSNNWGTVDFGTHSSLSNIIDADMVGSGSEGAISIECSEGVKGRLVLDGGQNAQGNLRRMAGPDSTLIPYRLYSNAGRTTPINPEEAFELQSSTQEFPVYGRLVPGDQGTNISPAAGEYNDIVVATLSW